MAIVYGVKDTYNGQVLGSFWRKRIQANTYKNDQIYLLNCNENRFIIIEIEEKDLPEPYIIREY